MSKELKFFIYLLERYAEQKGTDAQKIIAECDELGVTDYIYEMYEIYHIEHLQNAFDDIDRLLLERKG